MTTPTTTKTDNLAHIQADANHIDANDPKALFNQVSATSGCITVISIGVGSVVCCWSFSSTSVTISVELKTPFGNVNLVNATLNAQKPCVDFGGGTFGFKAEGKVCFDFAKKELEISGQVCAPIAGCKSGSVTIHV